MLLHFSKALLLLLFYTNMTFAIEQLDIIQSAIKKAVPDIQVDTISQSPVEGLFQVVGNGDVFYIDKTGQFLFYGQLIDLMRDKESWDLSGEIRQLARLKLLQSIPKEGYITYPAENKQTSVTIFIDPDCHYCRKLHEEVPKLQSMGVEVRYLAFPRTGPNSKSFEKLVSVWCADDRQVAMMHAIQREKLENKTCDNPVQQHFDLALKIGVRATPTIFFENGDAVSGYFAADKIYQLALENKMDKESS